ncbi:unnamed protein product [Protopolystoma xenopodis]|uniref:Kelch repeat protein n=1 Tax=Protopolystoma xenopodis TaxID=117903 RepID=A0A448X104_9PLAT|nr:unnamed protein product [Protopolystoma xenopodis]
MLPSMAECRSAGGLVSTPDGCLYALGGHNSLAIYASVECFARYGRSRTPGRLEPTISLPGNRRAGRLLLPDFSSITNNGGGSGMITQNNSSAVSVGRVAQSLPVSLWFTVSPMQTPRCRHGSAVLQQHIFVAGGYNGLSFLDSVEYFDPNVGPDSRGLLGQWTVVTSMNVPRSRVALVATAGHLYAIG